MTECAACGDCCKFLGFEVRDNEENRIFYQTHGQEIINLDSDTILVKIDCRCNQLTEDNKCRLHGSELMPEVCRVFPVGGQEKILPFCVFNS